ncbi:MAG: YidB family protein [Nitrospiraceae bacterium]|nr:YidB family protein [Nitrospiraceae bacterium]
MSFLDEVRDKVASAVGGMKGEHSGLIDGILSMVTNKESGGLAGLVSSFKEKGLGDIVSSWISAGNNLPISAEQIQQGIGEERLQQFAGKIGLSPEAAKSKLAELLPDIIDRITPEGKIPEGGLFEKAANIFRKNSAA